MRDRVRAKIAEQDAARGRPLTDVERLENLAAALAMSDDPHDHDEGRGDERK